MKSFKLLYKNYRFELKFDLLDPESQLFGSDSSVYTKKAPTKYVYRQLSHHFRREKRENRKETYYNRETSQEGKGREEE